MKLIAIEGPDKVGKATQSKRLAQVLGCEHVEIPWNHGRSYAQIYMMLEDGTAKTYPQAFQAFHAANRLTWQEFAETHRAEHETIVLDRWIASSYAYGRPFGLDDGFFECVNKQLRPADLTIVLDGDIIGLPDDVYESDIDFRKQVRREYLRWALDNDAPVVHANRSREEVHTDIMSIVRRFLG